MLGHSRQSTETHAMTGKDLIWAWIRARNGKMFTVDEAFADSALTWASVSNYIYRLARVGILQDVEPVTVKWTAKKRKAYRLAVDYGPDTPVVHGNGRIAERLVNFDAPRAIWATFRIHQSLGRPDLIASVNSGRRASYSVNSIQSYLRNVLLRAGYVVDQTPALRTSQYLLAHDTGPRAPIRRNGLIWDANLGKTIDPAKGGIADV